MKKPSFVLILLFLLSIHLTAFAQDTTPETTPEPATATPEPTATFVPSVEGALTIWSDAGRLPALEALGNAFTEQYDVPVRIQTMGFGDVRNNLQLGGPVGEGPDIVIGAHDWIGQLYTNGLITPLELDEALLENFDPVAIRAFTYDGQLVGLPYALEGIALYYNTDVISELPATWAETIELAQQLVADGVVERGLAIPNGSGDPYHHYPLFTGFGGYVFGVDEAGNYNPEDVGLDTPGGIEAMNELNRLVEADVLNAAVDYGAAESLFHEGQLAMWITGPWALNGIRESGVAYAVSAIPTMIETPRPFVGSQGFLVNAFSVNTLLAQAFLTEFMATDEGMQLLYDAVPFIPAWTPLAETIDDADLATFSSAIAVGDPLPAIPEMNAVWTAWGNAISLVYQGQAEPEDTIQEAAAAIREEIAKVE
jgi:arabinogalactan oligomer / maltooligosaccharide transport system substrate-binding protein